jgi:nucleoside-diphosphate-sugar epimerase
VPGVTPIHGDRTNPEDLERLVGRGKWWDAVIDTSSSELAPHGVLASAQALRGAVGRWVHVSTVSVYQGWPHQTLTEDSPVLDCPPDADATFGHTGPDGSPTLYGFQKAGAERAVTETIGADRTTLLRPGVILGPGEYVGRLPWWLNRAQRGGAILVPAPPLRLMQPVDVRDVADFAVAMASDTAGSGAYNVAHPTGIRWDRFIERCLWVTGGAGRPVWTDEEVLTRHGVRQWTELPLWRTHKGVWSVIPDKAVAAGLRCRPLEQTITDTWAWMQEGGQAVPHPRAAEHGIDPDKERKILADL